MNTLFRKTLPIILALQLGGGLIADRSNAFVIGLSTMGSMPVVGIPVFIVGWLMTGLGLGVAHNGGKHYWVILGLILDEEVPASHEIDFERVSPESLKLAYDEKTAETIWSELRVMDSDLVGKQFKFEYPKSIQNFIIDRTDCNRACRKEIKKSEREFLTQVATTFAAGMKSPGFTVSTATAKYLVEQLGGYTFLSTEKELATASNTQSDAK